VTGYAVFFPALTFAHRARCAAAILLRAAAESVRLARIGTTFCSAPTFSRTFAQRALWAAAIPPIDTMIYGATDSLIANSAQGFCQECWETHLAESEEVIGLQ
jgi:hypothetical protein